MQLSAQNVFACRITTLKLGSVEAEISLELSPVVVLTSVITRTSAVIKASDVMLAVE